MFISICFAVLFALMYIRRKMYGIKKLLVIPLAVLVSLMGLLGTRIMFYIENGAWYGRSFFGAVLFFPILLLPLAWIFRISLINLLSYATVPGMALLAVYKYNCYRMRCCSGKVLWFSPEGVPVHFPSQIVELCVATIIVALLLVLERKENYRRRIYPICLVIYGAARFILNYFRWEQPKYIWGLTPGAFWALVSVFIGITWLIISQQYKNIKTRDIG